MQVRAKITDLGRDDCGWMENGAWCSEVTIDLPNGLSDMAIARRIKAELGIQGMRADGWCGADWCWRDGLVGAYADVVG